MSKRQYTACVRPFVAIAGVVTCSHLLQFMVKIATVYTTRERGMHCCMPLKASS